MYWVFTRLTVNYKTSFWTDGAIGLKKFALRIHSLTNKIQDRDKFDCVEAIEGGAARKKHKPEMEGQRKTGPKNRVLTSNVVAQTKNRSLPLKTWIDVVSVQNQTKPKAIGSNQMKAVELNIRKANTILTMQVGVATMTADLDNWDQVVEEYGAIGEARDVALVGYVLADAKGKLRVSAHPWELDQGLEFFEDGSTVTAHALYVTREQFEAVRFAELS